MWYYWMCGQSYRIDAKGILSEDYHKPLHRVPDPILIIMIRSSITITVTHSWKELLGWIKERKRE